MAYRNLVDVTVTNNFDVFPYLRDFICARNGKYDYTTSGIGWELIDYDYAIDENTVTVGDWFVMRSGGELGNEQMYVRIHLFSTTIIGSQAYQYYNTTTHAGVNEYSSGTSSLSFGTTYYKLFIYGNLDYYTILVDYNNEGLCRGMGYGKVYYPIDQGPQEVSGALTAGSAVDITLISGSVAHPTYSEGRYAFLYDETNVERILITTNSGIDTITADLVNSYTEGVKLRTVVPYLASVHSTYYLYTSANYMKELITIEGNLNTSISKGRGVAAPSDAYASPGIQSNYQAVKLCFMTNATDVGQYFEMPNILATDGQPNLNYYDVMKDYDGTSWRYFNVVGVGYTYYKEV